MFESPLFFKNKEVKITSFFLRQTVVVISSMCIIAAVFWINSRYKSMHAELERSEAEFISAQKQLIKRETQQAIDYINFSIARSEEDLKKRIRFRVNQAHGIATNIYRENVGVKSKSEITKLIKDALRPLHYDNESEYIFITSLDGTDILFPTMPQFEGTNVYNFQDALGQFIVKDEINIVRTEGEGFSISYWKKPNSDTSSAEKKLSFVKLFEPFNWSIGTGGFYSYHTQSIKEEVKATLANYRYGQEGYIFINTYEGDAILTDGEVVQQKRNIWNLEDPNGVKVIQDERKAVKNPDGDFIYYSWRRLTDSVIVPKMSFVKGVSEWQWMVGTGLYVEDIDAHLAAKEKNLKADIFNDVKLIIALILGIFILLYLLAFYTSKRLRKNIAWFIRFFETGAKNYNFIDRTKINYSEFNIIAEHANNMILDLKASEERKIEEEAHYKKLFDESMEAIALVDKKGKVQRINNAFRELFGYEISEIKGQDLDHIIVPKELINEAISYTKTFKDGEYDEVEAVRISKDRKKIHVAITGAPVMVNGQNHGIYIIYRDITKNKEFEQELYESKIKAEESDRLKSSFLTNLSHEIRTPLNAIIGFSTLLNTKTIPAEDQKEYLRILGNSGKLLLEIIDNILDISKIESSTLIVNKTNNNLNTIVDELYIDFLEHKNDLQLDNIDLKLNKGVLKNGLHVFTDAKRLKQIFTNLLDNAFKFTEKGSVEFGYSINNNNITCFVKDTGIGIKEGEVDFIFDRFRQVDESTTRKYGGTGIGLALSKSLAELLDGKLWVESEIDKGSSFYFTIPLETSDNKSEPISTEKKFDNIDWSNKKVLIAEDVETNYKLLETVLERTSVKINWAKDGKEVLEMVKTTPDFDLILMDINMPIMTGHEALIELKKREVKIPVIAQTAYANENQRNEIIDLGYSDYILKPITFHSLLNKISKFLD